MNSFRIVAVLLVSAATAFAAEGPPAAVTIRNDSLLANIQNDGLYRLQFPRTGWVLEGKLPQPIGHVVTRHASDEIGAFHEITVSFLDGGRTASIRVYENLPVAMLIDTWDKAGANEDPFPTFQALPPDLMRFSYQRKTFGPYEFGALGAEGPWVLFDKQTNAIVLSPADHFQVSQMEQADSGGANSRIRQDIGVLPQRFAHKTLIAFGKGINNAFMTWGNALLALGHKHRIPSDAGIVLSRLGYWTDNGATYYYKYDSQLGYTGTLLAVREEFKQLGIPLGYMQLDSWWYPKGAEDRWDAKGSDPNFGQYVYRAAPDLFPRDVAGFHQQIGLPLVTHARWISPASPYRTQFKMSGNVAVDPAYWKQTADYLHKAGVITYEQDWLDVNAQTDLTLHDPQSFLGSMSDAMREKRMSIQYCMPLPSHYMASTLYQNVETIRPSDDRFEPKKWDSFLYDSRLASALGLWPWADVYFSEELNNVVLSVLSAGPVGVGDGLGRINAENLMATARADGVLLKPDTPLLPIDAMYVADASDSNSAMVATATSNFGSVQFTYVIAYPRRNSAPEFSVSLDKLGIKGPVVAYDWVARSSQVVHTGGSIRLRLQNGWAYQVLSPLTSTEIALLGDVDKITPLARQRFSSITIGRAIVAKVRFAHAEQSITVSGYAQRKPLIRRLSGTVRNVKYDAGKHLFTAEIRASKGHVAQFEVLNSEQ